jgi:hypothetical protein
MRSLAILALNAPFKRIPVQIEESRRNRCHPELARISGRQRADFAH